MILMTWQTEKSARSAWQHKARGVSPGSECQKYVSPRSGRQISRIGKTIGVPYPKINEPLVSYKGFRPLRGLVSQSDYR